MAAQTEAQVAAVELEKLRKKIPVLYEADEGFYPKVRKRAAEIVSKKDMRLPMKLRPGGKFGAFDPAGGDMGRGSGPTFDEALAATAALRFALEWNTESAWATDSRRKAIRNNVKDIMSSAMADFRKHSDALCMTGGNGVLGTVSAVSTGGGIDTVTLGTDGFGSKLLRFNQNVTYYEPDLSAFIHATEGVNTPILSIDHENKQITTAETSALAAADLVVLEGLSGASPTSLLGIPYHHTNASSGTWLGLNRANYPEIRCNRVNASSSALALPYPRLAINKIGNVRGIERRKGLTAWMHPCQKQAYEELGQLVSIIQKQAKAQGLDLYFGDNMQMAGAPVNDSYTWDKTRIDFISMDNWGRAEMHAPDYYDVEGRKVFEIRGASGGVAAAQVMYIATKWQLFCDDPGSESYIDGLTVPSGY